MTTYRITTEPSEEHKLVAYIVIIGGTGWFIWDVLSDWNQYEGIYRYVSFFYYSIIVWPLSGNSEIWAYMTEITGHRNLNMVFAVVSCALYSCLIVGMISIIKDLIDGLTERGTAMGLFALPGILLIPWSILAWLFS